MAICVLEREIDPHCPHRKADCQQPVPSSWAVRCSHIGPCCRGNKVSHSAKADVTALQTKPSPKSAMIIFLAGYGEAVICVRDWPQVEQGKQFPSRLSSRLSGRVFPVLMSKNRIHSALAQGGAQGRNSILAASQATATYGACEEIIESLSELQFDELVLFSQRRSDCQR